MRCTPLFAYIALVCSLCNTLSYATLCSERMEWFDREEIWREQTCVVGTALLRFPLLETPCLQGTRAGRWAGEGGPGPAAVVRLCDAPQCGEIHCSVTQAGARGRLTRGDAAPPACFPDLFLNWPLKEAIRKVFSPGTPQKPSQEENTEAELE